MVLALPPGTHRLALGLGAALAMARAHRQYDVLFRRTPQPPYVPDPDRLGHIRRCRYRVARASVNLRSTLIGPRPRHRRHFLCTLMVSICKGLPKRPTHSPSISYKACPGNPPGNCNEGFESALGPMITHKSHGHRMRSTLARPAPSVSRECKSLAQWVAQ